MRHFLAFSMLITSVVVSAQAKNKPVDYSKRLSGIEKELEKVLANQKAVGFSVAVVHKDKVILSKGFGYRDLENKKPVTPNTLFAIGSSTKAFTATILGQLEKDGKLKLNDPATKHLPQLSFKYDHLNTGITIRDMMCHRTGFSRFDYSWYLFNSSNRDSLIQRVKHMEPTANLREKWQYNNWMFLAQGMIAERITEKSWEQNIRERFFIPLEMKHSNTDIHEMKNDADASLPYSLDKDMNIFRMDYFNIDGMGPAGSINSCANDMANWASAWIMGGMFKGQKIIPDSYVKDASSSHMVVSAGRPGDHPDIQFNNYGLGWFLRSYRGHYLVEHGGNIDGFSANVAFYPTDSIGIVVLVNQNGSDVPEVVQNLISDKLFGLTTIPWSTDAKKGSEELYASLKKMNAQPDTLQVKNTQPSHPLTDYTGVYSNPIYGQFSILLENDTLKTVVGNETIWLKHYHYDIFSMGIYPKYTNAETESKFFFNFGTSVEGKIESVSLQLDEPGKRTTYTRSNPRVELSGNDLEKYVGEYDLEGQTISIYLKGNVLMVLVPGQPDYETVSVGNHTFELTIAKGFSVQFTVEDGKSTAITFNQPNGKFTAKRK